MNSTVMPGVLTSHMATSMNFTENQQGNHVLERLKLQRDTQRFCDVVLNVNGQKFHAHRNVLAACSPYFDSMLRASVHVREQLNVPCQNPNTFEVLLNYLYTGKVVMDQDTVGELLQLANFLLIPKLKEYCSEYLERNMSITNCFEVQDTAEKCGIPALAKNASSFIRSNINLVVLQNEVLELQLTKLEAVLLDENPILTEEAKIGLIMRWVEYKLKARERMMYKLLTCVQWDKIGLTYVFETVQTSELLRVSERCMFFLLQALHDNNLLVPDYLEYFEKLKEYFKNEPLFTDPVPDANGGDGGSEENQEMPSEDVKNEESSADQSEELQHQNMLQLEGANNPESRVDGSEALGSDPEYMVVSDSQTPRKRGRKANNPTKVIKRIKKVKKKTSTKKIKIKVGEKRNKKKKEQTKPVQKAVEQEPIEKPPAVVSDNGTNVTEAAAEPLHIDISEDDDMDEDYRVESEGDDDEDYMTQYVRIGNEKDPSGTKKRRRSSGKKSFHCPECKYTTNYEDKLDRHIVRAHRDDTTHTCTVCNFETKWTREFTSHMKTHFIGPPYHCDFGSCEYTADRIQMLLYHRMKHTDSRPFECPVCSFRFRTRHNLKSHLRCHTGEKPFQCPTCNRCFATKNTMQQHLVIHGEDRPYLCDLCGFSTKYQSHLIAHKRIHTGDVFRCEFENCKYFTPKKSQLAAHMRIHRAVREHSCRVCGKAFVEKSHRIRHERIHLDDKPFKCEKCDYASSRRDKLKEHCEKHHSENAPAKSPYKPRKQKRAGVGNTVEPQFNFNLAMQQSNGYVMLPTASMVPGDNMVIPTTMMDMQIPNQTLNTAVHNQVPASVSHTTAQSLTPGTLPHVPATYSHTPATHSHTPVSHSLPPVTHIQGAPTPVPIALTHANSVAHGTGSHTPVPQTHTPPSTHGTPQPQDLQTMQTTHPSIAHALQESQLGPVRPHNVTQVQQGNYPQEFGGLGAFIALLN